MDDTTKQLNEVFDGNAEAFAKAHGIEVPAGSDQTLEETLKHNPIGSDVELGPYINHDLRRLRIAIKRRLEIVGRGENGRRLAVVNTKLEEAIGVVLLARSDGFNL